jgi:uncharacterized delta-60 repeat protein
MEKVKRKTPRQYLSKHTHVLLALAIVLASTLTSAAQSSGALDATFGTGGKVTTDFGASAGAASVAVQPDGKIVAAGNVSAPVNFDFGLSRYNTDGTLDLSFGVGGKVTTTFGGQSDVLASVAIQQDGKIIVAGGAVISLFSNFALARYNSNGTLDASFGTGGKVTTNFSGSTFESFAESVAVQLDGKIVAAGGVDTSGGFDFALVRYNSDGTLDASFGTSGKVTTDFTSPSDFALSVAIQQDGSIVAAGRTFTGPDSDSFHSALARYNGNGTLDASFGTGGKVTNIFGGQRDILNSVAIQQDGKIVAAGGVTDFTGKAQFALARFLSPTQLMLNNVTVQTAPAGLQITVDGLNFTAPQNFNWVAGSNHTIATTSPQGSGGTRNVFANWSDGGAISHVVAPTVPTTFTANFTTQFLLTLGVSPSGGGTIGTNPSSGDGFYNSGTLVQLSAFPSFGFTFNTWSGDATGSTNPINVVMNGPKSVTANFTAVAVTGLRFVPVTPCRVADTRNPNGPFGGPIISDGTSRSFTIPSSSCGIPSTALAYSLNVTVVPPGPLGFLTIWPTGQPQPTVSTLNSLDGRIKANAAIVVAGTSGAVSVFASNTSHVILDINGYFTTPASAPSGLVFFPVTPCRVIDTRGPTGPLGGPILGAGSTRTVPVLSSTCGLPAGALAYSLNMTVVPTGALSFLTTWPTGQSQPLVSTLNDPTGTIVANAAIVPSGTGGSINVFVPNQTDLIIDVNGYFAPPAAGGLLFYATTPCRVVDTRNPPGPFAGPAFSGQRDFNVLAGPCGVAGTTQAYSFNATVVPHGSLNFLTLWPAGQPQPQVSTLNAPDGSIVSNAAIVATNTGAISAFSPNTTDLVLDLNGFFAP